jgi:hypothetical protein
MEKKGTLSAANEKLLPDLCEAMSRAGESLLGGLSARRINSALLDDLTLLTLGPQLRGGANVKKGVAGIVKIFDAIHDIVKGGWGQVRIPSPFGRAGIRSMPAACLGSCTTS